MYACRMISRNLHRTRRVIISGMQTLADAFPSAAIIKERGHRCVTGASLAGHQTKKCCFFENFLVGRIEKQEGRQDEKGIEGDFAVKEGVRGDSG
jgi:hypothetical protein